MQMSVELATTHTGQAVSIVHLIRSQVSHKLDLVCLALVDVRPEFVDPVSLLLVENVL